VGKPTDPKRLVTYNEFHIAVKGPKGSQRTLWRNVQTFEDLLRQAISAYMRVEKQASPKKRIVITIQ